MVGNVDSRYTTYLRRIIMSGHTKSERKKNKSEPKKIAAAGHGTKTKPRQRKKGPNFV